MKLHHIGIKTVSIEKAIPIYRSLGFTPGSSTIDYVQNNKILFLTNSSSGECFELIEPLNQDSTLAGSPLGLHHICYDLSEESTSDLASLLSIGKIVYGPIEAPALGNRSVVFCILSIGVMLEYILP